MDAVANARVSCVWENPLSLRVGDFHKSRDYILAYHHDGVSQPVPMMSWLWALGEGLLPLCAC